MATVQEFINDALVDIGVLDPGESPSASESNSALRALNRLIGKLNAEGAFIPSITREAIAVTGAQSYVLGTRPMRIKAAAVVATVIESQQVEMVDGKRWAEVMGKGVTAPFARYGYYEDGYPTGTLHLAPRPATAGTIRLLTKKSVRDALMSVEETFALSGAASYTIGVGGTFATERPVLIEGVSVEAQSSVSKPCELVSADRWAAYKDRGESGNHADILYYDGATTNPTIWLAPKPLAGSIELYTLRAIAAFAALADNISFPDGYEEALRKLLALDQALSYGRTDLIPVLTPMAADAKLSIFGLNQAVLGGPGEPPLNAAAASAATAPASPPAAQQQPQ